MKTRADIYREAFEADLKRMTSMHEINGEYRKLLEFCRDNAAICEQEQEDDTSLAAVLIRYIRSLEQKVAGYEQGLHYVWCNIAGTERGGFSESWNKMAPTGPLSLESMLEFQKNHPETRSYKLIEYRCLNDAGFMFDKNMKLR